MGDDYINVLEGGYDIVFLCSPNNPTGGELSEQCLLEIVTRCKRLGILPVIDMSFADFSENTVSANVLAEAGAAVIKAFTKIYAMPALRLGYMLCCDEELLGKSALRDRAGA